MNIKLHLANILCITALSIPSIGLANKNPCNVDCVKELIAASPGISKFTSHSWQAACPTGGSLTQGCFANAADASRSPIGAVVNLAFNMFNASPTSASSAVYIKKFPPGYHFTQTAGNSSTPNTGILYDASALPVTTRVICDIFLEGGTQPDYTINNDPANTDGVYNVFFDPQIFLGTNTDVQQAILYQPGVDTATALAVPLYVMCIGLNTSTNLPTSLVGFNAT